MNKNMTRRDFLKLLGLTVGTVTTTGVISEINKLRKENEAYDEQAETTNEQTENTTKRAQLKVMNYKITKKHIKKINR